MKDKKLDVTTKNISSLLLKCRIFRTERVFT